MNFHKTIGFLAALLLMIGLGAPDSFAQNTISVEVELPATGVVEEEATPVAVTVTLDPNPAPGTSTVTVPVEVTATMLDGSQIGSASITVSAIGGNDGSLSEVVTVTVRPPRDADADNETAEVTATAAGYASGSTAIRIVDDEPTILVTVTPSGALTGFREGTTVPATVAVTLQQNNPTGPRTDITEGDDFDNAVTVSVSFNPVAEFTKVFDDADADDAAVPYKPLKIEIPASSVTSSTAIGSSGEELSFIMKNNTANVGDRMGTATATLTGYVAGTTEFTLEDDEQTLTLAVDPHEFTEGDDDASGIDGAQKVLAVTVTLSPAAEIDVTVTATINGIPISGASVEATTNGTTGIASSAITVTLPDDEVNSDDRTIVLSAVSGTGNTRVTSNAVDVTVVDNDQDQTLTLTLDPEELREGGDKTMVAVTVAFAYRVTESTSVTVSATIDGVPVAESVTITVDENEVSGNDMLTFSLQNDSVDSGARKVVVAAVTGDATATPPTQIITTETLIITDDDVGPDAFTLSSDISNLIENAPGRDVEVTATLSDDLNAGVTVMVTLTYKIMGDEETATAVSVSGPITIVGPATTGSTTVNIDPSNDEVFTNRSVVLTGSALGLGTGKVTIGIIDDDSSVGTLTATANPPSLGNQRRIYYRESGCPDERSLCEYGRGECDSGN